MSLTDETRFWVHFCIVTMTWMNVAPFQKGATAARRKQDIVVEEDPLTVCTNIWIVSF